MLWRSSSTRGEKILSSVFETRLWIDGVHQGKELQTIRKYETVCHQRMEGTVLLWKAAKLSASCNMVPLKLKMIVWLYLHSDRSPRLVLDREPCLRRLPTGSQGLLYGQRVHWRLLWYHSYGKHTQQNPGRHYCGAEKRDLKTDDVKYLCR